MSRKAPNIYKRKDGRWEARLLLNKRDGKSKYKYIYRKTYKEAKEALEHAKKDMISSATGTKREITFSVALDMWRNSNALHQKESSRLKYDNIIDRHIVPELGNFLLDDITSSVICDFIKNKLSSGRVDKCGGLSDSYVKTMLFIINGTLKYATEQGYCRYRRNEHLKLPIQAKENIFMDETSQEQLEIHIWNNPTNTDLGIMLALYTGMRLGEICALKWEDIDLEHKIIHVRHTISRIKNQDPSVDAKTVLILDTPKTKTSRRDIPISSKLFRFLDMAHRNECNYVISGDTNFMSPRTFEYRFQKKLDCCGVPRINFHGLRHTFATRCIERGVDIKSLSEILGHANVGITLNTYVHSSMDQKRKQIEKLS